MRPGAFAQRRQRHATRADIADIGRAHRRGSGRLGVERQLDLGDEIAALIIAEKRFRARRGVFHRPAELARRPQHQAEFDEDAVAGAEIAADVVRQHAQPCRARRRARRRARSSAAPRRRCRHKACSGRSPHRNSASAARGSIGTPVTRPMWKSIATTWCRGRRRPRRSPRHRRTTYRPACCRGTSSHTAGAPGRMASSECSTNGSSS